MKITPQQQAEVVEALKQAERLNSELQRNCSIGSQLWHKFESLDDCLHKALKLLGD